MENKLSVVDRAILEKLIDPNQQNEAKYSWDEEFQRVVVGMLLCNRFFLCQSLGLIKSSYFTSEVHQLSSRILLDYFSRYRQMPSKIWMKQAIVDHLRDKYSVQDNDTFQTVKLCYLAELNVVYDYYTKGGGGDLIPELDSSDAVLDKIAAFAKTQAMKFAFQRCLDFIRKAPESDDTWAKVDDILKEARLVNRQTDLGLDYFNTVEDRYARMAAEELTKDVFTTGFLTIDHALQGGGMYRGELLAWMGKPGTGKSLSLVTASVKNVAQGKKVLYISTEMDSDRIATRFDAQFCLIGQHELMERKEEVYKALHDEVRDYDDKRRLVIKQFPSGTADVNTIRAFHSQCVINGFRPDLVIIDYPGDMKHSTHIKKYESMQNVLTDLRGFGGEEHHLTMVAIQPNRSSTELGVEEFMDESNQGDSFGQNRVLDLFATLNQTPHEQKAAVGRVFLAKVRNGKSRISFKIKYGFPTQTLTIDEISDETYRMLMSKVQDKDVESVETKIDKIITGGTGSFVPGEGEEIG